MREYGVTSRNSHPRVEAAQFENLLYIGSQGRHRRLEAPPNQFVPPAPEAAGPAPRDLAELAGHAVVAPRPIRNNNPSRTTSMVHRLLKICRASNPFHNTSPPSRRVLSCWLLVLFIWPRLCLQHPTRRCDERFSHSIGVVRDIPRSRPIVAGLVQLSGIAAFRWVEGGIEGVSDKVPQPSDLFFRSTTRENRPFCELGIVRGVELM